MSEPAVRGTRFVDQWCHTIWLSDWRRAPFMRSEKLPAADPPPQTRNELQGWVREHLKLPAPLETSLLTAIDAVFSRHERLWQESKHEAIQALSAGGGGQRRGARNQ